MSSTRIRLDANRKKTLAVINRLNKGLYSTEKEYSYNRQGIESQSLDNTKYKPCLSDAKLIRPSDPCIVTSAGLL